MPSMKATARLFEACHDDIGKPSAAFPANLDCAADLHSLWCPNGRAPARFHLHARIKGQFQVVLRANGKPSDMSSKVVLILARVSFREGGRSDASLLTARRLQVQQANSKNAGTICCCKKPALPVTPFSRSTQCKRPSEPRVVSHAFAKSPRSACSANSDWTTWWPRLSARGLRTEGLPNEISTMEVLLNETLLTLDTVRTMEGLKSLTEAKVNNVMKRMSKKLDAKVIHILTFSQGICEDDVDDGS